MKVLIIKLASMGDLIHLLPALTDAQKSIPHISFDWAIDKSFSQIATWHESVDRTVITNHRVWRRNLHKIGTYQEIKQTLSSLNQERYDLVIDAQGNIKSALLARCVKGPILGLDGPSVPEWGSHLLYDKKVPVAKSVHAIDRWRLLLAQGLGYDLPEGPFSYGISSQAFTKPAFDLPPSFLCFVPLASKTEKLWPEQHWTSLIKQVSSLQLPILIPCGNAVEHQRAQRLACLPGVIALPRLPLSQMAFIIRRAQAMVSLDTGLSHIAAALSVPNITLYGPTDPGLIGTKGSNQYQIKKSRLQDITPEEVAEKLIALNPQSR